MWPTTGHLYDRAGLRLLCHCGDLVLPAIARCHFAYVISLNYSYILKVWVEILPVPSPSFVQYPSQPGKSQQYSWKVWVIDSLVSGHRGDGQSSRLTFLNQTLRQITKRLAGLERTTKTFPLNKTNGIQAERLGKAHSFTRPGKQNFHRNHPSDMRDVNHIVLAGLSPASLSQCVYWPRVHGGSCLLKSHPVAK